MSALWLIAPLWLACSIIAFRVMLKDDHRRFKVTTRGDVAFFMLMAAMGPLAMPLVAIILAGDKPSKFFSKEVERGNDKGRGR